MKREPLVWRVAARRVADLHRTSTNTVVAECDGLPLVAPGDPDGSALIRLTTRKCGKLAMPNGCTSSPCIPLGYIDTLGEWIRNGADAE